MMQWQDFDFDGKVKIPLGYYLMLLYLLRAYVLWVISLTYRDDPTLILSLIYNDKALFFYSMAIGIPAVLTFSLFSLKSQRENVWFIKVWNKQRGMLMLALILDLIGQTTSLIKSNSVPHWSQMALVMSGCYLLWYWVKSKKVKRFFSNWLV